MAPKKASVGTWLVGVGARDASHVAMRAARWRSDPVIGGTAAPNMALAREVHRRRDDHRPGEAKPRAEAVLTARRTAVCGARAYPQSANAKTIAENE